MKVIRSLKQLQTTVSGLKKAGKKIGFVPTMGALHQGHISLVHRARSENDVVVVSIFVNPLQFGPNEDLSKYPRNLKLDQELLKKASSDYLFFPSAGYFYPANFQTQVKVTELSKGLCGKSRPVHFAGVATVVLKLLNLVAPHNLYLGLKDYQQYRVLSQMTRDLNLPVRVVGCPIVREVDGLAMSSRNVFLNPEHRRQAAAIFQALKTAKLNLKKGKLGVNSIKRLVRSAICSGKDAAVEYVEIVDALTLDPVVQFKKGSKVLVAAAVRYGSTRLIDNCLATVG